MRASELSYRRLFEAAKDGILILEADTGRISDANPFLCQLLGFDRGEMMGKTVGELSPFKDVVSNQAMLERLQQEKFVRYEDLPLEARDGRKIAVEFVCNVYKAGEEDVIQCNIRDIRERKRAEESRARLATAVEQSGETILITDIHGTILYANPAFEKTSGYSSAEAIGQNARLLKSGNHDAEFYHRMWQTLELGEIWTGHFVNRRKDGTLVEEDATISPVRNAAGTIFNYVAAMRDVTREMKLENQLRAIDVVMATKHYLSPAVSAGIAEDRQKNLRRESEPAKPLLSEREKHLLRLIAEGRRTKEIAASLKLAPNSVETYRTRLMKKIFCRSTAELVRYAIREGIAPL